MEIRGIGINHSSGTGKVIRIESYQEFSKIKGGEVVITKNATPDFILILKKISCLVTDQGGVTCHIAIICRELSIPAIIATGNATTQLTEGMLVTFDTEKGLIWSM